MINIEQSNGFLNVSYFNEFGDVEIEHIKIQNGDLFEWTDVPNRQKNLHPFYKSWMTKNQVGKRRTRWLSKWRQIEILELQSDFIKKKLYENKTPKKYFVDIETRVDGVWPDPKIANHEVTAISYVVDQQITVLGTKDISHEKIKAIEDNINKYVAKGGYEPYSFNYLMFSSEVSMLKYFFYTAIQDMPLLTGWNFIQFDWNYLITRGKRLDINVEKSSPVGKLYGHENLPMHRSVVDYLEIYKKWDYSVFKENNTLDYVAKAATGIGKIKFTGTFDELYDEKFDTYIFYNAIDSVLVQLIDRNIKTMDVYLNLGTITFTPLEKVFSPIALTENTYIRELLSAKMVVPYVKKDPKRGNYEGAYVFTPSPDLYEWVASFDFASLYPSIMRQWNMSSENFIGKFAMKPDGYANMTKTISNVYFDNSNPSGLNKILTRYYSKRKDAKRKMQDAKHDIFELKELLKTMV